MDFFSQPFVCWSFIICSHFFSNFCTQIIIMVCEMIRWCEIVSLLLKNVRHWICLVFILLDIKVEMVFYRLLYTAKIKIQRETYLRLYWLIYYFFYFHFFFSKHRWLLLIFFHFFISNISNSRWIPFTCFYALF